MVRYFKRQRGDLFRNGLFRLLFKHSRFVLILRILVAALFFYAIYMGFAHPEKENTFTGAVFWGIFWPFFIVTTLPIFGRIFCGICPHGFLGKYITRIGLRRKMPTWLQNRYIGLLLLFFGWWGVYYLFPGVYRTPLGTAILFTVMTLVAFLFYFLFRDMSYCKYICPIGTPLRAFGKLSMAFFGSYRTACGECKTFDCAKACPYGLSPFNFEKKQNMEDCTLCMECTHSCEAIRYRWVKPGYALYQKFKPLAAEIWAYILILAAIPISMAFAHGLNRSKIADEMIWNRTAHWVERALGLEIHLGGAFAFLYAALFTIAAMAIGVWIASRILRKEYKEVFLTLGYAFAPLFILSSMAHAWEFFFTSNSARIVEGLSWGFGMPVDVDPLAKRGESWLQVFHIFRWIAVAWAFYILYRRFAFLEAPRLRKILAYPFAASLIFFFIGVNFYRDHVLETYGRASRGMHSMRGMHGGAMFQRVDPSKATLLMEGEHRDSCIVCGMKLPMFYKTNHAATLEGKERQYCSLHCLAKEKLIQHKPLENLRVVDTDTLRFIPARTAWYVVGSKKPATMSKVSKYAFGSEKAARAFADKFGGRVTDFAGALRAAKRDFSGGAVTVKPGATIYLSDRDPTRRGMRGMGMMGHNMGGSGARPRIPERSFWLVTGRKLTRPRCVKNVEGTFRATDRDGKEISPKIQKKKGCTCATVPVPKNGYYTLYYLWETPEAVTLAKFAYKRFDHGSDEPFSPEKIAAHPLAGLPVDLVRLRDEKEDSFYYNFHTGDRLRFRFLRDGKPVAGARVTLTTQFGWKRTVRTDEEGIATFTLIRDYLPDWEKFNKRFRERFLVTAEYREGPRRYKVTYPGTYRPAREEYQSVEKAFWFFTLLLIIVGGGVFLYRMRVKKPFKEVHFDE
jgi:polyferredoxin